MLPSPPKAEELIPGQWVAWPVYARDLERLRSCEKELEAVRKELDSERAYGMATGTRVGELELWKEQIERKRAHDEGHDKALDEFARSEAAAAKSDAAAAAASATSAGTRAELADSRAQRANSKSTAWGAITIALTIVLYLVQHFTHQGPPPRASAPAEVETSTDDEGGE